MADDPHLTPVGKDEDLPLVDRALAGETQAFEALVRRHERRVYRAAMAVTGNAEDAEEAMQDCFVKTYQHLREFRRESLFSTWLTRIAVNEALQVRRRRKPTESLDQAALSDQPLKPRLVETWRDDPEKLYARQEMREIVEQAIRAMPAIYREAFVLRDVEGLTSEEAAQALGLALPALKSRLLRARLLMREALAARCQRPTTMGSRMVRAAGMMRTMAWMMQSMMADRLRRSPGREGKS